MDPHEPHDDAALHGRASELGPGRARRVRLALVAALSVVAAEVVGGALAHSTALFADAGHNLADAAGIALAGVAIRLSGRAPTASRSFGYHRATILTAVANVGMLWIVTVLVSIEAVIRLVHPVAVRSGPVIVVAAIALVANLAGAFALRERHEHGPANSAAGGHRGHRHGDLNLRSSALHLSGDAASSAGVALSGVVELATGGWYRLDAVVSLAIALVIGLQGVRLARQGVDILLESTPPGLDTVAVRRALLSEPGVIGVHDLHCWSLSSELWALSAHLVLDGDPALSRAHLVGEGARTMLAERFEIAHATLELECEPPGAPAGLEDDRAP